MDDNLVVTEVLKNEQFKNVGRDVKVYKNDVIEFKDVSEGYYMFSDGSLAKKSSMKASNQEECDGYLCYWVDKDANGFVTQYQKYTTNLDTRETVTVTDAEEKYRIASEATYKNQIHKYTDGDNTVILCVVGPTKLNKITISKSLTKTEEEAGINYEIRPNNYIQDKADPFSPSVKFTVTDGMMYFYNNAWAKVNVGFNGNFMFIATDDNEIMAYNMTLDGNDDDSWHVASQNVVKIDDMYYKDGQIFVKGINTSGQAYYATLSADGTATERTSDIIMGQTVILPLN